MDVTQMVHKGFVCCKGLGCVEKFASSKADIKSLRAEQNSVGRLSSKAAIEPPRDWVRAQDPVSRPSRSQGSMLAAGIPVCKAFFR